MRWPPGPTSRAVGVWLSGRTYPTVGSMPLGRERDKGRTPHPPPSPRANANACGSLGGREVRRQIGGREVPHCAGPPRPPPSREHGAAVGGGRQAGRGEGMGGRGRER